MIAAQSGHTVTMKILSFLLTGLGLCLLTLILAVGLNHHWSLWYLRPTWFTWGATVISALAMVMIWIQPQLSMFLLFGASLVGIPGWLAVWAGPGSFFLSAALLLLVTLNQGKPPRSP